MPLSVGLLLYRDGPSGIEVLIAHMGGPFWARKDDGGWTIPKGLREGDEALLAAAEREFAEEMGAPAPTGPTIDLGPAPAGRKTNHIFAREGDFDAASIVSNTFELEWPRGSGVVREFPEVDRAGWFTLAAASPKLVTAQRVFLDRLVGTLS
ncbi:MAG: NUDIX domain-containing protein [Actinomycetota bacterium]